MTAALTRSLGSSSRAALCPSPAQLFLLTPSAKPKQPLAVQVMFMECIAGLLPAAACCCSSVFEFHQRCVCPSVFVQSFHHNVLFHPGAETHSKEVAVHFDWQRLCYRKCVHVLQSVMEMDI